MAPNGPRTACMISFAGQLGLARVSAESRASRGVVQLEALVHYANTSLSTAGITSALDMPGAQPNDLARRPLHGKSKIESTVLRFAAWHA